MAPGGGRGPDWVRLLPGWDGPLVRAALVAPPGTAHPLARLDVTALVDTGATHTIVDTTRVAEALALRAVDRQVLRVAGRDRAAMPVCEVGLAFPDFSFPLRRVRVGALDLPPPFAVLIGMDLLDGTRLALEWRAGARWMAWEPLDG